MKLQNLMSYADLLDEVEAGYVRARVHPLDSRLRILNYTEKAQYEKRWNDVTRQCRGLIVNFETWEVLARPFDKFFNVGEHEEGMLNPAAPVEVTDKMDGSLGILYPAPDGWAIATRGSFTSEQAIHATELLRTKFAHFEPVAGVTYLFEIIYPGNRIVLDYGRRDTLVLLGARIAHSGQMISPADAWKYRWEGPVTPVFPYRTLAEALSAPPRPNAEGLVVRYLDTDLMVKIKQEDYVRLHKLVTGLNERAVWEHLSMHQGTYTGLLADVPDEFHDWVADVANDLLEKFEEIQGRAHHAYDKIIMMASPVDIDPEADQRQYRKWFAEKARGYGDLAPLLFQLLDGRDISNSIWRSLRPVGETKTLMDRNEDVS